MDSTSKNSLGDGTSDTKTWHERRKRVEDLGSTEEALFAELEFTAKLLRYKDARNKYAWSHRQWVLEKLDRGYADKLGFCEEINFRLFNTDNRLMWDQRCFAVQKCLAKGMAIIRSCEICVAVTAIKYNPEVENPWRYLRFLFKNDMKALARSTRLQWGLICIFVRARDSANAVRADKVMYKHTKHAWLFDSVNERGCLFALDLISDLLKYECQLDDELKEVFEDVFQEYNGNTIAEKVESVLREHRNELWADFSNFEGVTTEETILYEDDDESPFFPRSELKGKAGFSNLSAVFIPDDPDWLADMRKYESNEEGPTLEVTKDDHEMAVHVRVLSLENEMELLENFGQTIGLDNYLFWHRRRCWVSEYIGSDAAANNELKFTEKVLTDEPNNHYAWSHRQWVRQVFFGKDWGKAELDCCNKILKEDAYNCLAWNHRYFVLQKHPKRHEMRGNEVKYAIAAIQAEPENEMPWRYLKCLVSGKNYKVLNDSSTFVLSNVVRHINEGKVDICDDYVKKRVVNALKMVLFAVKRSDFKPNHELKTNIDYFCPPNAAEESFAKKVVSILCSMDVTFL